MTAATNKSQSYGHASQANSNKFLMHSFLGQSPTPASFNFYSALLLLIFTAHISMMHNSIDDGLSHVA